MVVNGIAKPHREMRHQLPDALLFCAEYLSPREHNLVSPTSLEPGDHALFGLESFATGLLETEISFFWAL